MRRWTRVVVPSTLCGGCGHELRKGEPILAIEVTYLAGKVLRLWRCAQCEGPAPPDLPADIVTDEPRPPIDLTRFGLLPLDFSRPTREPGEEG